MHVFHAAKPKRALLNIADDDAVALRRGGEQQIIHVRAQQSHEVTCAVDGKVHCRKNSRGTETSFHGDVDQFQVEVPPCVHRPVDGNPADEDISRVDSGVRKAWIRRRLEQQEPLKGSPLKVRIRDVRGFQS